jgi:hypothetical protein
MQLCSYTSKWDLGKALAILASEPRSKLEKEIHLSGDAQSFSDIADIMIKAGGGPIEVTSLPLEQYKRYVVSHPTPTPERYLRFLIGEGKINHTKAAWSLGCQNELVDQYYLFGEWTTVKDHARETKGKPWADKIWLNLDDIEMFSQLHSL